MKAYLLFIALLTLSVCANSQGRLVGKVTDKEGSPIIGAIIRSNENQSIITDTDFDGLFELQFPDASQYTLRFDMIGFAVLYDTVLLRNNDVLKRDYTLFSMSDTTGAVLITAKASKAADSYMEKVKINSTTTIDYISSETIKKTGDSNVINAIARVSGVSTNGGMITVRGIGDRYVKTTLNGSRIPTLDPLTNNIKLDIFPSSLVDNIVITKTASPEYSADWSGAYVSVETKDYPDKLTINLESQIGFNEQSTFKDIITSDRSSTDWLGFDSGMRTREGNQLQNPNLNPGTYNELVALGLGDYFHSMGINGWIDGNPTSDTYFRLGLVQLGLLSQGLMYDQAAYQQALDAYNTTYKPQAYRKINPNNTDYNNGFTNNWNTKFRRAPLSLSQNISIGNQTTFLGKQLGFFVGFRYGNNYRYDPNGLSQRVLNESLDYQIDFQDKTLISRETNSWSALVNLAYKLNENNKISFLFMPNVIGTNDVASFTNIPLDVIDQTIQVRKNLFYEQRKQMIYQYASQHFLSASKMKIDVNASYTAGQGVAPDFRTSEYAVELHNDSAVGYQYYPTAGDGIRRFFRYLTENTLDARISLELPLAKEEKERSRKLKFGAATQRTYRKSDNEEYRVMLGNNNVIPTIQNDDLDAYMSSDRFIMSDSLIDFYYLFTDFDRNHNFGHSNIDAAYVMTNWELTDNLKFSGGVRAEHTDLFTDVDKFARLNYVRDDPRRANLPNFPNVNPASINRWDFLPSGSIIYKIESTDVARTNLRFNYSRTLARPSVRELNDAAIIDNEFRTFIYGNSDLKIARVINYDFRGEIFFGNGDNISVSLFYKDFHDHIEMGFGNIGITWQNIQNSNVKGLELEGRKKIGNALELRANVTLVKSKSEFIRSDFQLINGEKFYLPIDTIYRPMYGQAPYLINAICTYKSDTLGLTATVSYNVQGPRLVITGTIKGVPDVYEIQRHLIDFKLSKKIGNHFTVGLTIRDLLNAPVRRAYKLPSGWFDYDNFRYGTTYLMSFAYSY
ncbi:MAG: TonB-dependent receptor domain-containing protein [Flavobacteriales bacterium]